MDNSSASERGPGTANRLIHETSPYLLQHAHNPVDWHPWGEEAFEKARREDKPLLISIGYSACHWCHVMERESFENPQMAALINETVVPVKVDREERPDVDAIYMNACQAMTGQGGWPLNAFVTPEGKPFFVGTYFPPDDRYGRPSFATVLQRVREVWTEDREHLTEQAEKLHRDLARGMGRDRQEALSPEILTDAVGEAAQHFDVRHGGFGSAPKFPPDQRLALLLEAHHATGSEPALQMVTRTLEEMAWGGMYDQLAGGFARYSVDARWLIPHFEKMLYNQALLVPVYLDAFLATQNPLFRAVGKETLDWVLRDLRSPEGGFFAAYDADSEGEEGKYYVWTPTEVTEILGEDDGALFCEYYDVTPDGNFEHGTSALNMPVPAQEFAEAHGMVRAEWLLRLEDMRQKMLQERAKRIAPGLDDKIITGWNGLMISAFARGMQVLGDKRFVDAGVAAAEFILKRLRDDRGGLLRIFCKGQARVAGVLEDYAYFTAALVDLYETTLDPKWLHEARRLAAEMWLRFGDMESGGFFTTDGADATLISRGKETHDGALPAAASVAAQACFRLASLLADEELRAAAEGTLKASGARANMMPSVFASLVLASRYGAAALPQIVIAGEPTRDETRAMVDAAWRTFLPVRVIAGVRPGEEPLPVGRGKEPAADGSARAFVCANYACQAPVDSPDALTEQLKALQTQTPQD